MRLSTTTLDYYSSGMNQISPADAIEKIADIPGSYSREHVKLIQKSNLDFYRRLYPTME